MKKVFIIAVALVIAVNCVNFKILATVKELKVENELLKNYYLGAEELLDTLENHYNWVDAIDNEAYYDAVDKLHHNK